MLTGINRELANALFYGGAVKFNGFRLKLHEKHPDAPLSPIYIDLRILRSLPKAMETAAFAFRGLVHKDNIGFACYADVPTSITPVVAVLSFLSGWPMISPRIDVKTHGLTRTIDGIYKTGEVVLLVDDLITTADSKLEVISVLKENGLIVNDVMVLVDREQGGAQKLTEHGYNCHSVFTLSGLLDFYDNEGLITQQTHERVITYLQTPQPK